MAKNITFGILYGLGNKRLAQQLSTTTDQAKAYKQQYFNNIHGSRSFINRVISTVESRGWIKNRYGRIYKIDNTLGYKGVNYLVQGTSADILNERIIYVHEYLKDKKSNILLQVHDEIICEILNEEGSMARLPDLLKVAKKFNLKIISIKDLISYRLKNETLIKREDEITLPTEYGNFKLIPFRQINNNQIHLALIKGDWSSKDEVLVRVHSSCIT